MDHFLLVHILFVLSLYPVHGFEFSLAPSSYALPSLSSQITSRLTNAVEGSSSHIHLHESIYNSQNCVLTSMSIKLSGKSTIITSSVTSDIIGREQSQRNHKIHKTDNIAMRNLFVVSNSTVTFSSLIFELNRQSVSIAQVKSSHLTLHSCSIHSASDTTPFLVDTASDSDVSIFVLSTNLVSQTPSVLLPLASFSCPQSGTDDETVTTHFSDMSESYRKIVSITQNDVVLRDQTNTFGCGPLFDSRLSVSSGSSDLFSVHTCLGRTSMTNMSSVPPPDSIPHVSQTIFGSHVTHSSHHMFGTCCSPQSRQSSLTLTNSSFSHCSTTLAPVDENHKQFALLHREGSINLNISGSDTDLLTVTRCTFKSLTGSQASLFVLCEGPTSVKECSFIDGASSTHPGGSIYVTNDNTSPTAVHQCSFLNSSAPNGGNAYFYRSGILMVDECVFKEGKTKGTVGDFGGGGMWISYAQSTTIRNCQIHQCESKQHRNESGNDFNTYWNPNVLGVLADNVRNCDTTTGTNSFWTGNPDYASVLTLLPDAVSATVQSIEVVSVDAMVTLKVTVNTSVKGTLLVDVDNTADSAYDPTEHRGTPAVHRLLSFPFLSEGTTATCAVPVGSWGLLQFDTWYTLIGVSIENQVMEGIPTVKFIIPGPPRICDAECLPGTGLDHALVKLTGKRISRGTYEVEVEEVEGISFEVTFENDKELIDNSTAASVLLFGDGAKLTFSTNYTLKVVRKKDTSDSIPFDPFKIWFFTPAASTRLTGVNTINFLNPETEKICQFRFVGEHLTASRQYQLTLTSTIDAKHTRSLLISTDTKKVIESIDHVMFPHSGDRIDFGREYRVTQMVDQTSSASLLIADFTFTTPPEPPRLKTITTSSSNNGIAVSFAGFGLIADSPLVLTMSSDINHEPSQQILCSAHDSTEIRDYSLYPKTADVNQLKYDTTYTIERATLSGRKVHLEDTLTLTTPEEPPRVENASIDIIKQKTGVEISLTGVLFETGSYKVTFTCSGEQTVVVSGKATVDNLIVLDKVSILDSSPTFLVPGKTYIVSKVEKDSMGVLTSIIVNDDVSVLVPNPPIVSSLIFEFVNSLQNLCKIQVRGSDFVAGTEYEVTLNSILRIGVRFKTSTEGESDEVSIGQNGQLKHNTKYTLTEMTPIREDDGEILCSGTLWFETGERIVMEVIVREGGSDEREECGTIGKPCESVLVGWRVGEDEGMSGVVVKIDRSGGFGGRVVVGEKDLEIGGLFEGQSRLVVDEGDLGERGEEEVIAMSGGSIVIVGVTLCLPPSPLKWNSDWQKRRREEGGVLSIVVGSSNVRERREVGLLGNVFVDSSVSWSESGEESRGGIIVRSVGVGQTKIDLRGSWFEETAVSGVILDRDEGGIPIVEKKRKIVHTPSHSGHTGLVVVVGRVLPVIRREGSSFSGCSLRMVSGEAEQAMEQHTDEL
ncbi:hypothetical protein BLNAU_4240 [Blattamonas nauphoetae]|uniref:Uncharacterized protein n=1 Tax=Blattamonas nauphoetae TaxID=2049346 RepID=A0ABQ9YAN5_9EUKA|nr:hypothetical protein BLNAU_4240 [Blattamonas nauphoetae]